MRQVSDQEVAARLKKYGLNRKQCDLFLKFCDGGLAVTRHPNFMRHMAEILRYRKREEILQWLVLNNLTGDNFAAWLSVEHGESLLSAMAFVLMKLRNEKELQPVLAGRDYLDDYKPPTEIPNEKHDVDSMPSNIIRIPFNSRKGG